MPPSIRVLTIHLTVEQQAQSLLTFTVGETPPFLMHAAELKTAREILQAQNFDLILTDPVTYEQILHQPLPSVSPVVIIQDAGSMPRFPDSAMQQLQDNIKDISSLRRSERLYRLLAQSAVDIIALHDNAFRTLYINPAQEHLLGWPPRKLVGKSLLDFAHPEDHDHVLHALQENQAHRSDHTFQWRCRRSDGEYIWLETSVAFLPLSSPFQADRITQSRDITGRRATEEQALSQQHWYRNLINASIDGIVVADNQGIVREWNHGLERITGYSAETILGRPFWEVMRMMSTNPNAPDRFQDSFMKQMGTILNTPELSIKEQMAEQHIVRRDGTHCIIQAISFLVPGKDQPMLGSIVRDVTELVQTREELRMEQRLFAEGPIVVLRWKFAPGYPVEIASDNAAQLFGYTSAELTSGAIRYADLVHEEDRPRITSDQALDRAREKISAGLTSTEGDYRIVSKDGAIRWVHDYTRVILDPHGDVRYLQGYILDITDRVQVESELLHANQQLKNWVEELEQRNASANLLNSIGDLLQICNTVEDTFSVLEQYAPHMFKGQPGVLYLSDGQPDQLDLCVQWGERKDNKPAVLISDCWGLRRSRTHLMDNNTVKLRCRHVSDLPDTPSYLCVPVSVQGKNIGLLHQVLPSGSASDQWQQLAEALAEQLGLVIANIRLRETLREQALHDPLTGLYNRYFMEESLERELAQAERAQQPVSLIMLDLDHFKTLNTRFGHPNVDVMLAKFGEMLRGFVRQGDIPCRYGGDEFLVIFPGAPIEAAFKRAEQLRQQVKLLAVRSENGDEKHISASIGVAAYPENATNAAALLRAVDAALYQAKTIHDTVILAESSDSIVA